MKKFHIAISTDRIAETIQDYTKRLGKAPCSYVENEYALWRTESLNVSIRHDPGNPPGSLRHLGWEDDTATAFSSQSDVNGITWERFSAEQQAKEINELWPLADYDPSN